MANHPRHEWSDVRADWTPMGTADGVAIHHTASVPQGFHYDPTYLRRIEHGEIAGGYNALAYHTMWFDDGDSAESRPYGVMGAATGGHNGHTIAMCAMGYFHPPYDHLPSDTMCIAIAAEIHWLRAVGFLTWEAPVLPHAEWTRGTQWATACCGSQFIPKVGWIDAMSRTAPLPPQPPKRKRAPMATVYQSELTAIYVEGITAVVAGAEQVSAAGAQGVPIIYVPHAELMENYSRVLGIDQEDADARLQEASEREA